MLVPSLAWRNIWRHPLRSFLTISGMTIASGVVVFFFGIQLSSYGSMIDASTRLITGHFQIQREGFLNDPDVDKSFDEAVFAKMQNSRGVPERITPRGVGFGLVASDKRTVGVQLLGIDPKNEPNVTTIPKFVTVGKFFDDPNALEIVIGKNLATVLDVSLGDAITVLGQGAGGSSVAFVAPVVGIFETKSIELDRSVALIPLRVFQEQFYLEGKIHTIVGQIPNIADIEHIQAELTNVVGQTTSEPVVVLRWDELLPGIRQMIRLDVLFGWLFYSSLIVISVFGLVNTISMSVVEREGEFGILRSLGIQKPGILRLVLLESFFLSAVGVMVGIGIGVGLILYFGIVGFSVPGMEEVAKMWNLPPKIYPTPVLGCFIGPVVVTLLGLIGCFFPAYRACNRNLIEVIHRR